MSSSMAESIAIICGFGAHSIVLRTLSDGYNDACFEIAGDPLGVRHLRTMEETDGTIVTISTRKRVAVYSREPHSLPGYSGNTGYRCTLAAGRPRRGLGP